jgi:hypothetical protein
MSNPSASEEPLALPLSDTQLDEIMLLFHPLALHCCDALLRILAYELRGRREIGEASYIGLRAPSSRTIACSTHRWRLSAATRAASASTRAERADAKHRSQRAVPVKNPAIPLSAHTPGLSLNDAADRGKPWQPWSITISTLGICHKTYLQRSG